MGKQELKELEPLLSLNQFVFDSKGGKKPLKSRTLAVALVRVLVAYTRGKELERSGWIRNCILDVFHMDVKGKRGIKNLAPGFCIELLGPQWSLYQKYKFSNTSYE